MASEPVVVESENDRNTARRDLAGQVRGEAGEVLDVDHVRGELVQHRWSDAQEVRILVALRESHTQLECVVDTKIDTDRPATAHFQLRAPGIGVAGQHRNFGRRQGRQRGREIVHVDFGATMGLGREPVHDEQDTHQMRPVRSQRRPSRADRAPRYWPRGNATPSAAFRIEALTRPRVSIAAD